MERSQATPPSADWTPAPGSPGWSVRALLEAPGLSTSLMRVEPGTITTPHAHAWDEQVYILEGSLYDDDGTEHPPGTFIVRGAGAIHSGGSRGGATMLVFYSEPR
ncbi:cupin domain-containing protein [Sphingomonas profundi]|uniref:cupin domain-containing protein n=1 Tax=Alterirhizorhabdus profundi TaxID=2681549 RepID=UPI001E2FCA02|nr:cupin domain-containing protein [Sphingomonas profundi]